MTETSSPVRASAPGKVVLIGEYAVLLGNPAVVAAVDRRAVCTRTAGSGLVVVDGGGVSHTGTMGTEGVRFATDERDALKLVRCTLDVLRAHAVRVGDSVVTIDTAAFREARGMKLGLGSSAAACAALVGAFIDDEARWAPLAQEAHRAFSDGLGSGIDVAAAVHGGIARFERGVASRAHAIPTEVNVLVAFAGHEQDSRSFVSRFLAHDEKERLARGMTRATARFMAACATNNPTALFESIDDATEAMTRISARVGIDVVSKPHQRINALLEQCGGKAKPSGAGGGDVAVCFVPADNTSDARAVLENGGFAVLDLALGAQGLSRTI